MIVLTNCLAGRDDEGSLKVAKRLISAVKKAGSNVKVITYEHSTSAEKADFHLNKAMLNSRLARFLLRSKEDVLFVPQYARMLPTGIRIRVLSLLCRGRLRVLLPMLPKFHWLGAWLIRQSGAELIVLSKQSETELKERFPNRITYLKAGVDPERFHAVETDAKIELRRKYRLPADKKIVLHVGHMKFGRNLEKLLLIDEAFHVLLVTSTTTAAYKDAELEAKLRNMPNLTIIDEYLPNIEELYQLADVYLFPVVAERNCIDIPLSAFEAAACNIPVVCTPYGELKEMAGQDGFTFIDEFDTLNERLYAAVSQGGQPRETVIDYDWKHAAASLL